MIGVRYRLLALAGEVIGWTLVVGGLLLTVSARTLPHWATLALVNVVVGCGGGAALIAASHALRHDVQGVPRKQR